MSKEFRLVDKYVQDHGGWQRLSDYLQKIDDPKSEADCILAAMNTIDYFLIWADIKHGFYLTPCRAERLRRGVSSAIFKLRMWARRTLKHKTPSAHN